MLKRPFFISFFILLACISQAQFDTSFAKKGIRLCADSLIYGFKTKNWDLFARYSNPAMIGSMGGTEEFKRNISTTFAQVPDSAWKMYKTGNILQVIKTPAELQSVIELNSVIEHQGQRITATSYLVGQSWDGGRFWTFFDSQSDINAAKTIKPDIAPELILPPKKEKLEYLPPPSRSAGTMKTPTPTSKKTKAKAKSH